MWVWSVVLAVLSSRMSAVGFSLASRRGNVPCLAKKSFFFFLLTHPAVSPYLSLLLYQGGAAPVLHAKVLYMRWLDGQIR
jgi:hypothetical protein